MILFSMPVCTRGGILDHLGCASVNRKSWGGDPESLRGR